MKIVIVNSFFTPWRGGAETYVCNLALQLQRRGHEVKIVCADDPFKPGEQLFSGVRIRRLKTFGKIYGTPIIPTLPFNLAFEESDIIHAGFPSPYNAFHASMVSRLRRIPSVLTWHNDLPALASGAGVLVAVHEKLILPSYLPQFRYIIATSKLYTRISPILAAHKDRVVVVPHGVDTTRFTPSVSGDEIRSRFNLGQNKVILFVGALTRWHRYKGVNVLIRAVSLLDKARLQHKLLIVGGGELTGEYAHLSRQLGLADRVIFAGEVPDNELPKYYACSDVLVLPSVNKCEGFGLVILEANATGKPAIGSAVGGIPAVIKHGYNGLLVPPSDPKALAEVIRTALRDEDMLRLMGKNGRAFAELHDWSTVSEQTEKVYTRATAH